MAIFYSHDSEYIVVSGKTYPYKDRIKALGARFLGDSKAWQIPFHPEKLKAVEDLCVGLGGGAMPGQEPKLQEQSHLDEPVVVQEPIEEQAYTVKELYNLIGAAISTAFPVPVWVVGEIQNFQARAQGIYLNLAEEDGKSAQGTVTANANIWPSLFSKIEKSLGGKLSECLSDGLRIRCLCQVNFYRGRGNVSLNIIAIDANYLKGALALAREALLKELRSKGLDQANKKLKLVKTPFRIGLLSAEGSRAQSDFLHQLEEGGFPGEVLFCPVAVQGEGVPKSICRGMDLLVARGCDAIVITRGGGSAADLRWFDSTEIAYKIVQLGIPVIAAIGHHDDYCVAEEIAYLKKKTPTAAADFFIECFLAVRQNCELARETFKNKLSRMLMIALEQENRATQLLHLACSNQLKRRLELLTRQEMLLVQSVWERCGKMDRNLSELFLKLSQNAERILHQWEMRLGKIEQVLAQKNPLPWMAKGWTQLFAPTGKSVKNLADAPIGSEVQARVLDGVLALRVEGITSRKGKEMQDGR